MSVLTQAVEHIQFPLTEDQLTQAQRLFHGRGHGYPGLNHLSIDWLPPVLLITLYAPEEKADIQALSLALLEQMPSCRSVQLQHRYQLAGPIDTIWGEALHQLQIKENNLQFNISLGKARNTGLFLDMKNGRQWVQSVSHHQRVLNLFSYTCAFSVAAIAGQAQSVLNIDMSRAALNAGRENHRINQQAMEKVSFEKLDIFKSFGRLKKRGPFDLLICDPPTFQKGSVDITRDYPKILRRLNEFMSPKSQLLLCLNAPELGPDYLIQHMKELAPNYQFIKQINPPEVFKEAEGKGLTVLNFKAE